MKPDSKIYVAGHRGLVGSAIVRALERAGYKNLITRTHAELDLLDGAAVEAFFAQERPEYIFLAAAKVGGIMANSLHPTQFIADNLAIELNIIGAAHRHKVTKLLFLGSSCIYPKMAPQPIKEEYLLTGPLEETNRAYALAKIAGIELCRAYRGEYGDNFIAVMPTNLYGPNDNFHPENSHVMAALMRRFHEAKQAGTPEVVVWGTGTPRREFLHTDDLAEACVFLMNTYDGEEIVNIGTGADMTIRELAEMLKEVIGYTGALSWDESKPDGTPLKRLDVSKLSGLGWKYRIPLADGLRETYAWYQVQV